MLPIENVQEFRSVGAMNITSGQSGRTKEPLAGQGPSNGAVSFMMEDFRQSSEAVGLSQVSKMLR